MYKSPVELIYKDAQYRIEEGIFKAIQEVDIKVNKEELIKALEYDRKQYEKGYEDGKKMGDFISREVERRKGNWEEEKVFGESFMEQWQSARCSVCGLYHTTPYGYYFYHFKFCPHCGADMSEEKSQ